MKPTIIVEGLTDVAILRTLLPAELVNACNLMPTAGRSTIVSVARNKLSAAPIGSEPRGDQMTPSPIPMAPSKRATTAPAIAIFSFIAQGETYR